MSNTSGHATLATAQIVFNQNPAALSVAFQSRKRGTLVARKNSSDSSITLDFPASSLVTLADGHKRRDKVLERVKNVVAETAIRRIDWADEIDGVVIELSPDVDLERLAFDPSVLVSRSFCFSMPHVRGRRSEEGLSSCSCRAESAVW